VPHNRTSKFPKLSFKIHSGRLPNCKAAEVSLRWRRSYERRGFKQVDADRGLGMMGLASCDHYNCASGPNLGTSCTSTGSGLSGGKHYNQRGFAFVFAGDPTGTIDSYTLSAGASTFAATSAILGNCPANISATGMAVAQGLYLYAVYYETGQIFGWSIGSDGSLTAISGSPFSASYLLNSAEPGGWQTMITNPTGTLLFVEDLSGTAIYTYQIGQGGVLTADEQRVRRRCSGVAGKPGHGWVGKVPLRHA